MTDDQEVDSSLTQDGRLELGEKARYAIAASPTEWLDCGDRLRKAAQLLLHEADLVVQSGPVNGIIKYRESSCLFVLLIGLALENVLKAMIVAREPRLVSGGKLAKKLRTHDLVILATAAGVASGLSSVEQEVLGQCSRGVISWTRYPVPLSVADLSDLQVPEQEACEAADALYVRLARQAYALCEKGWAGPHGVLLKSTWRSEYSARSTQE